MAIFDSYGPYELTSDVVNNLVTRIGPGSYCLGGNIREGNEYIFYVGYVGRDDVDVRSRIKDHVGEYTHFTFQYATSPKNAFEQECNGYHEFGENVLLKNKIHPRRPDGATWKCPVCDIFDD